MSYYNDIYGPEDEEDVDPDKWMEDHKDDIPPEIEDEIDNGTCVSTEDIIDTDEEPSYTMD